MKQIPIGTCVPGQHALKMLPGMKNAGFECFEICFHMEFYGVDIRELAPKVLGELEGTGAKVSAVGLYCNPLAEEEHFRNLCLLIENAKLFGVDKICTFAGALPGKSVEEAMPAFKKVFGELAKRAADQGLSIAFENCPMGGDWRRPTCNLAFAPRAWEMMFNEVPADNLGLEWEPAHAMSQLIDPIAQLRKWVRKVIAVHGKDCTADMAGIREDGILCGKNFLPNRMPGFGDTNWRDVFFILRQNGFEGDVNIEGYHDPVYGRDWEMTGQLHALKYLKWARGGDFVPNPWEI